MNDLNDHTKTEPQLDPETASEVLDWATARLDLLTGQLTALEERAETLRNEVQRMTTLREQLQWAVGSRSDENPAMAGSLTQPPIAKLSRVDAVLAVLDEAERPLAPADIRDRLHKRGRDDDYKLVSSSLDYLRRSDRAHRVGRGEWVAGSEPGGDASHRDPDRDSDE